MEKSNQKNISITYDDARKIALDYSDKKIRTWGKRTAGAAIVTLGGVGAYFIGVVNPGFFISTGLLTSVSLFGALVNYVNYRGLKIHHRTLFLY